MDAGDAPPIVRQSFLIGPPTSLPLSRERSDHTSVWTEFKGSNSSNEPLVGCSGPLDAVMIWHPISKLTFAAEGSRRDELLNKYTAISRDDLL